MSSRYRMLLLVSLGIAGCNRSDDAPKRPLSGERTALPPGHPDIPAAGPGQPTPLRATIGGAAKAALDSGNVLYRARNYAGALAQYRRAASLAPDQEAPLIGIMMVANVTGNARLGDSITTRLGALNGPLTGADSLSAAELKDIHAGIRQPAKPSPPPKKL